MAAGNPQQSPPDLWTACAPRIEELVKGALLRTNGTEAAELLFPDVIELFKRAYTLPAEPHFILRLPQFVDSAVKEVVAHKRQGLWDSHKHVVRSLIQELRLPLAAQEFQIYYAGFLFGYVRDWFFAVRPELWPAEEVTAHLESKLRGHDVQLEILSLTSENGELRDEQLVRLVRDGHEKCGTMLLERYATKVHELAPRIIYAKMLCPATEDAAEFAKDVAQDVSLKLLQHMNDYRFDSSFEVWMGAIIENEAKSRTRKLLGRSKQGKRKYISFEELQQQPTEPMIHTREHREILRKALDKHRAGGAHNAKSARVIELRYFEDLDIPEVAERVGTTKAYVYTLFSDDYPEIRRILVDDFGITGTDL